MDKTWMIYGANGYTGELIARAAKERGMKPVLAGRNPAKVQPLARELGLDTQIFQLDQPTQVKENLNGVDLVLLCAGPFSSTSAPMIEGCLASGTHYLDITGEINVLEHAHASRQSERAAEAGIVLCPGVGFDVIPTDCLARKLKELLPDASSLSLGFESDTKISPGTMKTMVEGLGSGSRVRRNGLIREVPLGSGQREIDFGNGVRPSVSIPWGDVSTARYTTGIGNIVAYAPMPKPLIAAIRLLDLAGPLLEKPVVQDGLKTLIDLFIQGPDEDVRKTGRTYVWGEARNPSGVTVTARIQTANVYTVTVEGTLKAVSQLFEKQPAGGSYTPSTLFGAGMVEELPGSGNFHFS